jgi:hypothetical protein
MAGPLSTALEQGKKTRTSGVPGDDLTPISTGTTSTTTEEQLKVKAFEKDSAESLSVYRDPAQHNSSRNA